MAGLEECLHELLSDRARHLKSMENLASQLRRRDAAAVKAAHDLKALTARLECAEQDKSSLEKRALAAGEEHRVERARWFVHKQVRYGMVSLVHVDVFLCFFVNIIGYRVLRYGTM